MKNILLMFSAVVVFTIITAAGAVNYMTVKPARPASTVTKTLEQEDAEAWISKYVREGYQVHQMVGTGADSYRRIITIVMVKY
jgi:hypothetical protein